MYDILSRSRTKAMQSTVTEQNINDNGMIKHSKKNSPKHHFFVQEKGIFQKFRRFVPRLDETLFYSAGGGVSDPGWTLPPRTQNPPGGWGSDFLKKRPG